MTRPVRIAPSILSADFGRLAEEIRAVEQAGRRLHPRRRDGRAVRAEHHPGPVVVEAVRKATKLPVDVHLMIVEPEKYIEAFAKAGANILTVHQETCPHLHRTIQQIRAAGAKPSVVVNPSTPVSTLEERAPGPRHGAGDEREPRLRRAELHPRRAGEDPQAPEDDRRARPEGRHRGRRRRERRRPRPRSATPEPTSSSPGTPCSARRTTGRRSRRSGSRQGRGAGLPGCPDAHSPRASRATLCMKRPSSGFSS